MFWVDRRTADVMQGERAEVISQGRPEDTLLGPYSSRADAETAARSLRRRQGRQEPGRWDPEPWESWEVRKQQLRQGYPLQAGSGLCAVGLVGLVAGLGLDERMLVMFGWYFLAIGAVLVLTGLSLRR